MIWVVLISLLLHPLPVRSHGLAPEAMAEEATLPAKGISAERVPLFIDPSKAEPQRKAFVARLQQGDRPNGLLYDHYLPLIGANGILDGLEYVWPKCHSEAHALGQAIYEQVHDLGQALVLCAHRCYSGCMHGAVWAAITPREPRAHEPEDLSTRELMIGALCREGSSVSADYSPGDCAHAVGHALMFEQQDRVPEALAGCRGLEDVRLVYYCATGAYMEYVTTYDARDAEVQSILYPCDSFDYPAACARYKMVHVVRRHYAAQRPLTELHQLCAGLTGAMRLGCFHGLGNAHVPYLAAGRVRLQEVCQGLAATEERVCVEGAIERLAKYDKARAAAICQSLEGEAGETCRAAVRHGMYSMGKDPSVYLAK